MAVISWSMSRLINFIKSLLAKNSHKDEQDIILLRKVFKARYNNFKLLLSANNKVLEIMTNLELALQGKRPFGLSFIKNSVAAISVNVYRMIKNLLELAPGKYEGLNQRFKDIHLQIDQLFKEIQPGVDDRLVIPVNSISMHMADLTGNKMANLGEIRNNLGLNVPNGFVITAKTYHNFFSENNLLSEINRLLKDADAENMQQLNQLSNNIHDLITGSEVPEDSVSAIMSAYGDLTDDENGNRVRVALRSSSQIGDVSGKSYAGQYESKLNVDSDHIIASYKEVVASKYSLSAIIYRLNRGHCADEIAMCVGCLTMVDAESGGVAYSRNPMDLSDDSIYINAVPGLPTGVCEGSMDSDLFVVSRVKSTVTTLDKITRKIDKITNKNKKPPISLKQARALADIALRLEEHYKAPQDIEWAITKNNVIYVLQCRPIKQINVINKKYLASNLKLTRHDLICKGGVTASAGAVSGPVYLVEKEDDFFKFPRGCILVTRQALPRWAPLLTRALGIITEQGGVAGHLGNVAREFGVPALFRVEGALSKLHNGETITVDSIGCAIYCGRVDSLLTDAKPSLEVNAVQSTLTVTLMEISKLITPLNLLDPDSPGFSPKNCRTFHDITRYIHEQSVKEMFAFGKNHHFRERSSKQFFNKVPMNWWILNLDDGFKEEIKDKYVRLEHINSVPMLALWEGINAVPWEGPPPIDVKGFMSVMFNATTNPALSVGVKSKYAERNYFMISKNFCSFTSRLGFHFSTIEALCSENASENYIRFNLKGGAADYERRLKRARFVGNILEDYGYKIQTKEDNLVARLDDADMVEIIKQLRVLGYLTIHIRQLDMIMLNEPTVNYYRSKIQKDIIKIMQQEEILTP